MKLAMEVTKYLSSVAAKVNRLSLRERTILFVVVNILVFLSFFVGITENISIKRKKVLQESAEFRDNKLILESDFAVMQAEYALDPDEDKNKKIKQIAKNIENINKEIVSQADALIPPHMMVKVLRDIFEKQEKVSFFHLKKLPLDIIYIDKKEGKVSIVQGSSNNGADADSLGKNVSAEISAKELTSGKIYLHGVEIAFESNYSDAIEYLNLLELLPWKIIWESLEYEVKDYPNALITVHLRTLGYDETWLGV